MCYLNDLMYKFPLFSFQLNMGVLVDSIYQNKFFVENLIILTSVLQIYTVCEGMICEGYVFYN